MDPPVEETPVVATEEPVVEAAPPSEKSASNAPSTEYTYIVQKGFIHEGRTFHAGETIPVKCRYCSLWEKEYLGKIRCKPGKLLDDGSKMQADLFSCETFFICKELDFELNAFLSMGFAEVITVRRMIPAIKKLLETEGWMSDTVNRKEMDVDKVQVFQSAKGFITSFTSTEQITLAEQFLRSYAKILSLRDKAKRPPKVKFEAGDWIEWVDAATKEVIKGVILSKTRGQIKVAAIGKETDKYAGHSWTFNYKEFTETRLPRVIRKSVHEDQI